MILCGLDLETSAIENANILEIACVLYCTESRDYFEPWSTWVWSNDYNEPTAEAMAVNGLNVKNLKRMGQLPADALEIAISYIDRSEGIIAHNGLSFDKPILEAHLHEHLESFDSALLKKPWIDPRIDLPYPPHMSSRRLTHLATDHGVYYGKAHRALIDVFMMLDICKNYDLEEAFQRAQSPVIRVEAIVPRGKNEDAKKNRYRWDPGKKCWWKNIREIDYEKEEKNVGFAIIKGG